MPDEPDPSARAGATANDASTGPDPAEALRGAVDVIVGLGIMAINRVQAVRREVTREPAPGPERPTPGDDPAGGDPEG
jgi:hypothetical protein